MTGVIVEKIFEMLLLTLAGALVYKVGLIDRHATSKLSNLLLMFVLPTLIFESYQMEFDPALLHGLLVALGASALTAAATLALAPVLMRGRSGDGSDVVAARVPVERLAVVYSNCGFIGVPLIEGLIGAEGVLYMAAYNTLFNVLLWTHGAWVMGDRCRLRDAWRHLLTPVIVAVVLGLVCFVNGWLLPEPLLAPVRMVADMNTPLAMIVAGATLAQGNLLSCFGNPRVWWACAVKLVVYPAVALLLMAAMHIEFNAAFTVFIGTACPVAVVVILFAERFGKDASYAAELFAVSTVLSAVTIPVLSLAATALLG